MSEWCNQRRNPKISEDKKKMKNMTSKKPTGGYSKSGTKSKVYSYTGSPSKWEKSQPKFAAKGKRRKPKVRKKEGNNKNQEQNKMKKPKTIERKVKLRAVFEILTKLKNF